jgi:hypothetical protein
MRGIDGGVYADLAPMHVVRAQTGGVVGCGGGHFHFLAFLQQVVCTCRAPAEGCAAVKPDYRSLC